MLTEKEVYLAHAHQYEQLIQCEDAPNNLPKEIKKLIGMNRSTIVEFGAGTGRLTRILLKDAKFIAASDISHHMLVQAKRVLGENFVRKSSLCVADMRRSSYGSHFADVIIAGWSFCYLAVWGIGQWKEELQIGLREAKRLLKPGGVMILFENFGTGFETPHPPFHLKKYFDFLNSSGFQSKWIRTDFKFRDLRQAVQLSDFFFGSEISTKVKMNKWVRLPECPALFWKYF